MKKHCVVAVSLVLACASIAFGQENKYPDAKPMYKTLPNHTELAPRVPGATLTQWNGSFTDITKQKITYTMVGTDPSKGGVSTTVPVYIIPIKMVYGKKNGNHTFNPITTKASNGLTVVKNIVASPLFNPGVNFTQGGTNLGTTQYIDAFQRGNFWKSVSQTKNAGYHVLLGQPTVLAQQSITVTPALGNVMTNPVTGIGVVGTYDINAFDAKLQTFMAKFTQINPGVLPLFVTVDIYLTDNNGTECCIGGYHSANGAQPGGQTYSYSTYEDGAGSFAQDVSALSHELGEWMDDPFVDNDVQCTDNGILEVGDPLENDSNFGAYPYTLGSFTYNLQSLVFIGYFGAPKTTSVHGWLAFQNDKATVCPGQ